MSTTQDRIDSRPLDDRGANRDPLSGAPGAHPGGTGIEAAAGALTGTVAGPVGTVVGAAIGAIAGGLAGKGVAEVMDPTVEDAYWRDNFSTRPYVGPGARFDDYGPAYGHGVQSYGRYSGKTFDEAEADLARDWPEVRGSSKLDWNRAKHATRDAWNRVSDTVERAVPGDSDRDGK